MKVNVDENPGLAERFEIMVCRQCFSLKQASGRQLYGAMPKEVLADKISPYL